MSLHRLVEAEIALHDWSKLTEADGPAIEIPAALMELLSAESPAASTNAYWKLENHVVVQGGLFDVSVATVAVICSALVDDSRARWVKIQLLELLFQIINGEPDSERPATERSGLRTQCRNEARKALWIFYRIFQDGDLWDATKEILEILEPDQTRLRLLVGINREHGRIDESPPLKIT